MVRQITAGSDPLPCQSRWLQQFLRDDSSVGIEAISLRTYSHPPPGLRPLVLVVRDLAFQVVADRGGNGPVDRSGVPGPSYLRLGCLNRGRPAQRHDMARGGTAWHAVIGDSRIDLEAWMRAQRSWSAWRRSRPASHDGGDVMYNGNRLRLCSADVFDGDVDRLRRYLLALRERRARGSRWLPCVRFVPRFFRRW